MALAHKTAEGPDELRKGSKPALQCGGAGERRGPFCGGVAGLDAAAVGVADDDDVLDVEVFDGVGEHCGRVVVVGVELAGRASAYASSNALLAKASKLCCRG